MNHQICHLQQISPPETIFNFDCFLEIFEIFFFLCVGIITKIIFDINIYNNQINN